MNSIVTKRGRDNLFRLDVRSVTNDRNYASSTLLRRVLLIPRYESCNDEEDLVSKRRSSGCPCVETTTIETVVSFCSSFSGFIQSYIVTNMLSSSRHAF